MGEVSVKDSSGNSSYLDFKGFIDFVNVQRNDCKGYTVELHKDIDITTIEFSPIGTENTPFAGTFDGRNHSIKNLDTSSVNDPVDALFAYTNNATIKNIKF